MRLLSLGIGAQFRNSYFEQISAGIVQIPTNTTMTEIILHLYLLVLLLQCYC